MKLFKVINYLINANKIPADKKFNSDIEKDMYINNTMGHRDKKDRLDYQNKLLDAVNNATAQYSNDNDLDAIIKAYEHAFIEANPPCHSSQNLKLVGFYVKKGELNKAWGYLNRLQSTQEAPTEKIRNEQFRILKKEKRFIPALDMLMGEHLLTYSNQTSFNRDRFLKEAGVCTRALKWDEGVLNDMADMLAVQLKNKDYNESKLHDTFSNYLKSKGLLLEE